MKFIPLKQGGFAIVDDRDFCILSKFKWRLDTKGYVQRTLRKSKSISLHVSVLGVKQGKEIDHVNGNKLDNRRANLRHVSHSQNMRNMKIHKDNKSGFKGVSLHKHSGLHTARICVNRISIHLGYFKSAIEASLAYCKASLKYHGVFGRVDAKPSLLSGQ